MVNKHKIQKDFYTKMSEWKEKYKAEESDIEVHSLKNNLTKHRYLVKKANEEIENEK